MAPVLGVPLLVICVSTLSFTDATTNESQGFSLSIISIFSRETPFYQANLTQAERLRQISNLSDVRALWLNSAAVSNAMDNTPSPEMVRANLQFHAAVYLLHVRIGTPPRNHFLQLDTGSSLVWVQCEGCHPCFPIRANFSFNWRLSNTFQYMSCDDPLCIPRWCSSENKCLYNTSYLDSSHSAGMLARDMFQFASSDPGRGSEVVNGVVFGCGTDNVVKFNGGNNNIISGILAMGRSPQSFFSQLRAQVETQSRFSYCLPDITQGTSGFLRFGCDAEIQGGGVVQSTPLLFSWPVDSRQAYYVELQAISVEGNELDIPQETFQFGPNGTGGNTLDVGCALTYLRPGAYDPLHEALERYFSQFGLTKFATPEFTLCYQKPPGFNHFPSIQFHFNGAIWDVRPRAAFLIVDTWFCLTMKSTSTLSSTASINILGAFLQINYHILYDVRYNRLYFSEKNCNDGH